MIVLQRIFTSYKKLAEDAEVEVSRKLQIKSHPQEKQAQQNNPHKWTVWSPAPYIQPRLPTSVLSHPLTRSWSTSCLTLARSGFKKDFEMESERSPTIEVF